MSEEQPQLGTAALEYLNKTRPMLIDGKWVYGQEGGEIEILNPATEKVVGVVSEATEADVDLAVAAARKAFNTVWRRVAPNERSKMLWKLADLLEEYAEELVQIEVSEQGLPISLANEFVIPGLVESLQYYGGWATKINGTTLNSSVPDMRGPDAFGPPYLAYSLREPIGVVGGIVPWNFPLIMVVAKLAPALAAGCTCVIKLSELAPLACLRLGELFAEAGFPDGVVNLIPGYGARAGARLAAHPDVDKITFTGSTATGRQIATTAAQSNFKKVSLEMGGKSPIIICDDANLEGAIDAAAEGIFMNTGQICFAGTRVLAQKGIFDDIVAGLVERAKALKIGNGMNPDVEMGPLISGLQKQRVMSFFENKTSGVSIETGGNSWGSEGYFVEPTIAVSDNASSQFMQEEIFGPVLTCMPFETLDDAISVANNGDYGLSSNVWTSNLSKAHGLAAEIHSGSVFINCHSLIDEGMPFGGYKQSGWGREGGLDGVLSYMETKAVMAAFD